MNKVNTVIPGRNYRVSPKGTWDVTTEFQIIGGYVALKCKEKVIKETLELNKPTFIKACDTLAEGDNQITFKYEGTDVLLYTVERKQYEYSKAIQKLEAELKKAKEQFETKNEPVKVTRCWAVKL